MPQADPSPRVGTRESHDAGGGAVELFVLAPNAVRIHALPASGAVSIGRSDENTVVVDDRSVSRRHAVLHVGATLRLEDLGSANGTQLRDLAADGETGRMQDVRLRPHAAVDIRIGDTFTIGSVTAVVRQRTDDGLDAVPNADPRIVLVDRVMRELYAMAARVARVPISVLILGDTGVGKEVLAEHIHRSSPRAAGPFVRLNCAAFSETLLESELFGHEKGAFTGAAETKPGLLEVASGGTIFLDEVGELPAHVQSKLLRVVEDRQVLRVGALEPRAIDLRIVAATHRDPETEMVAGRFRRDLYYRLNGVTLSIPALRDRPNEIVPLAERFLAAASAQVGDGVTRYFTSASTRALQSWRWPGNVRELKNTVERSIALSTGAAVEPIHLALPGQASLTAPASVASSPRSEPTALDAVPSPPTVPKPPGAGAAVYVDSAKREKIIRTLDQTGWNQKEAAKLLGVSLRTLIHWLDRHAIPRPRKKG